MQATRCCPALRQTRGQARRRPRRREGSRRGCSTSRTVAAGEALRSAVSRLRSTLDRTSGVFDDSSCSLAAPSSRSSSTTREKMADESSFHLRIPSSQAATRPGVGVLRPASTLRTCFC